MAPSRTVTIAKVKSDGIEQLDVQQVGRASAALLRKIQSDVKSPAKKSDKQDLLSDVDEDDVEDNIPVWLVLTTKKHIVDKKRLKPGKLPLPHPILDATNESLRICLITADPQRMYKDLIAEPTFPVALSKRIHRVIGLTKLKAKYKSFESRRQLLGEYDIFLADDRVVTYLPNVLGKVFYKGGSKRPIPVSLEGRRQSTDAEGNKRRKLADGGTKVVRSEAQPLAVAHEIQRALDCTLVHLAPSTTTAVKVGTSEMEAAQINENIQSVVDGFVDKYVPQKWSNVRSIHIKGPNTVALPIWMTSELWENEKDVLEQAPAPKETKKEKKRKRAILSGQVAPDVIEVPGPDGVMRKLTKPSNKRKSMADDTQTGSQSTSTAQDSAAKDTEKLEKASRALSLKQKKEASKAALEEADLPRKKRVKAADLL